jgi:hypothetical protein
MLCYSILKCGKISSNTLAHYVSYIKISWPLLKVGYYQIKNNLDGSLGRIPDTHEAMEQKVTKGHEKGGYR